ncbi:MAG: hypothetical protein NC321_01350 [Clostridium sp.]|nr:hypothetical protein [Clostridium sp.]
MQKVNWKIVNLSFWIEVILSYLLPFKVMDNFRYQVGFPIPYLSVYDETPGVNPFMSMHFNPLSLLFNVIIIYMMVIVCIKAYRRISRRKKDVGI